MNEHFDSLGRSEVQAELGLLRKKIEHLEKLAAPSQRRFEPWRRLLFCGLALVLAALLALGVMAAQSKQDALYIDQNGNVGINQTKPEAPLDVNGNTLVRGSIQINGNAAIQGQVTGKLDVTGDESVGGLLRAKGTIPLHSAQAALPANNGVVIGNSDLYFTNTGHQHTGQGNQTGFAAIENDGKNFNTLMILGRSTAAGRMVGMWDRVGIGKGDPQASLDVNGDVLFRGTINGEKPPIRLKITATRSGRWNQVEQDIGSQCGDEDGCRIKLLMEDTSNGQVRTLTEEIIIDQPGTQRAPGLTGLRGYTRQSGGGEYEWRLDTDQLVILYSPWDWCKATNFRDNLAWGQNSPAFRGNNKYKISFECHPNVTAWIIIYDR